MVLEKDLDDLMKNAYTTSVAVSQLLYELGLVDTPPLSAEADIQGVLEWIGHVTSFFRTGACTFGNFCIMVSINPTLATLRATSYSNFEALSTPSYELPVGTAAKVAVHGVKPVTRAFFDKLWYTRGQEEAYASARTIGIGTSVLVAAAPEGSRGGDAAKGGQG